jgi:PAS domain-containing protein
LRWGDQKVYNRSFESALRVTGHEWAIPRSWRRDKTMPETPTLAPSQDHERRFEILLESITDYAILMLDPDGRVGSWNKGAEQITGYRADEIIG